MISSEVQRTLVKSPPELWAELSDPAALARHLGELGDIRITRIHPEEKVEWAAADASGSVVIKPSGWGTRVTLTVTREMAPPQPQPQIAAPEPTVAAEPTVAPAPGPLVEAEPALGAEPGSTIDAGPAPAIEAEPASVIGANPEPAIEAEPASVVGANPEPAIEAQAAPEVEAVPTPVVEPETQPALEVEPAAFTGTEPMIWVSPEWPSQTEPEPLIDSEPAASGATHLTRPALGETLEPEQRSGSRRSLFARLFRRRRSAEALAPAPHEPEPHEPEPHEPEPHEGEPHKDTMLDEVAERGVDTTPEAGAASFDPPGERPLMSAAFEPHVFAAIARPANPSAGCEQTPEPPRAVATFEAAEEPQHAIATTQPPVEPPAGPPAGDAAEDIAAALRDAEEVAAEEVTAVLTSMLDRLGAAHHRPFSRA
jgi:hypothetical protein